MRDRTRTTSSLSETHLDQNTKTQEASLSSPLSWKIYKKSCAGNYHNKPAWSQDLTILYT